METRDPKAAFLRWFRGLWPELRQELALVVLYLAPGYPVEKLEVEPSALPRLLTDWVDDPSDDAARAAGRLVTLRGLVDFFVVRSFGAKETWEKDVRIHKKIMADMQERETVLSPEGRRRLLDFCGRMEGQGMSLRHEWEAAAGTWSKLCSEQLSDRYLETWTFDTLPDAHFRQGRKIDPQEPESWYDGVVKG